MVDLSFDHDDGVPTEQVAVVTAPDNSWNESQNAQHNDDGSTRQVWICPMCNEQFEGRLVTDVYAFWTMLQVLSWFQGLGFLL